MNNKAFFKPGQMLVSPHGNLCFGLNEIYYYSDTYEIYFIKEGRCVNFSQEYISKYFKPVISNRT